MSVEFLAARPVFRSCCLGDGWRSDIQIPPEFLRRNDGLRHRQEECRVTLLSCEVQLHCRFKLHWKLHSKLHCFGSET